MVLKWLLLPVLLSVAAYFTCQHLRDHFKQKVEVPQNGWYGSGTVRKDDTSIKPFKVAVPPAVIEDLTKRVSSARISHAPLEDSDNFEYGFNSNYLKTVQSYWTSKFNWSKQEALLNKYPQFTTQIEGLKVHFYHVKSDAKKYKRTVPMLIVHGWPGNVFEFYKLMPLLLDPSSHNLPSDVGYELIIPSIPGYGFSEAPTKTGFSQVSAARVFHKLMHRLGHTKFYLQGGDWGSVIQSNLAKMYPDSVYGVHLNMMAVLPSPDNIKGTLMQIFGSICPKWFFSHDRHHGYNWLSNMGQLIIESGYMHLQATKPDTVGTALNDSPIGLAAYILEKFSTWTNPQWKALPDGGLTKKFTLDELLTVVTIYWTQGNIVSSQRFYKEFFLDWNNHLLAGQYLSVPTLHAQFKHELFDKEPQEIVRTAVNLTRQEGMSDGGHFSAFEEPLMMANSITNFVAQLERNKQ